MTTYSFIDESGETRLVGTISPAPGGGSQSVKSLDLGVVTAVEVATGGPKLLYTPASNEIVHSGKLYDVTFTDVDLAVAIGTLADMIAQAGNLPQGFPLLAYWDTDLSAAAFVPTNVAGSLTGQPSNLPFPFLTDPIVAAWCTPNSSIVVDAAPGTWQANHAYAEGAWIIDSDGALEHCTTAGTSGGSVPSWPGLGNAGTTTTDGSTEWTQEGDVPTAGSAHILVIAETPTAP